MNHGFAPLPRKISEAAPARTSVVRQSKFIVNIAIAMGNYIS